MELSILIPSRNEMFLARTIKDILENIEADTEVIAVLDGKWADPEVEQNERVKVIYMPESVGQRAATNIAARIAKGKYIMKVDAHCSFDKGFDRKMLEGFKVTGDNVTVVPIMRNLWAFDWQCKKCKNKWYQGPTPTFCCSDKKGKRENKECDGKEFEKIIMWKGKEKPQSTSYAFDSRPHFEYFGEYTKTKKYKKDKKTGFTETMGLQGSCFMLTKDNYWKWDVSDETAGSWGNQGIEVACKTWLTGGRVLVNHNTWYAHMFRTQGGDFGFPYKQRGKEVNKTKSKIWTDITEQKIPHQKLKVDWLIERFMPVKDWTEDKINKL